MSRPRGRHRRRLPALQTAHPGRPRLAHRTGPPPRDRFLQAAGVSQCARGRRPAASSNSRRFSSSPRLADLIPQPRRHRHRYHGVFAPNHPLRPAVTALAVGNVGKQRDAVTGGHGGDGHGSEGCCDANHANQKPRSHDTSRIAWAKLMARGGEVSARVPGVRRRHPAQRRLPAGAGSREVRGSQAEEGQDGFARVKSATDTSRRTARTAAGLSRSRAAHRLGRDRPGARRPPPLSIVGETFLRSIDIHSL